MGSLVTRDRAYWACPRIERPEKDEYTDGTQKYIQSAYRWHKSLFLWYALGTTPSESEISDALAEEFSPGTDYVCSPQLLSGLVQEHPDLSYCHLHYIGIKLSNGLPDITGQIPYYLPVAAVQQIKISRRPLADGNQDPQNLGTYQEIRYQVRWARCANENSSQITKFISQFFYPQTNYILDMQSLISSLRPISPKNNAIGRFDGILIGKYLTN